MAIVVGDSGRLKREDCKRTRHDSNFSKWQLLIGPSDWQDYSLGKEGASRYRVHNLPTTSAPGLYELGIAVSRPTSGRDVGKLDPDDILVAYLGQSENVRTRLQRYGRSAAHLGLTTHGINGSKDVDSLQKGLGLFEEIFSRGHSIVFRWAPMNNKRDSETMEGQLLGTFDYAWNKGSNGVRRPNDILQKFNKITSSSTMLPKISKRLLFFSNRQVGIKIKGSKPPSPEKCIGSADEDAKSFFPGIFKFSRSHPRLVTDKDGIHEEVVHICGFVMNDGIPCKRLPISGRKRCEEHKGRRVYGSSYKSIIQGNSHNPHNANLVSSTLHDQEHGTPCGLSLGDGTSCSRQAVAGRKRCEEHKGMRVNSSVTKPAADDKILASPLSSAFGSPAYFKSSDDSNKISVDNKWHYGSPNNSVNGHFPTACGATLVNGSLCRRQPVQGNKRCWQHKGQRVDCTISGASSSYLRFDIPNNSANGHFPTACGATLVNGSLCRRQPVQGNKRCWQHKGQGVDCTMSGASSSYLRFDIPNNSANRHFPTACGATLVNGSFCRRQPVQGNKRCWQHKGQRVD